MGLITLMKGQPLAYNKDNQEDKEPLFDTVDTLKDTLRIFAEMIGGITDDVFEVLTLRGSLNARDVLGGTAPAQVRAQITRHRERLS